MHPDAFFAIGRAHLGKVCQDYARAGRASDEEEASGRCFAVVSDGCSTSPDTDVGARLVVLPHATGLYPGVVIQDMLGSTFASLLSGPGIARQIRIRELDPYRVLDARYDGGVLMVVGTRNGKHDRLVFRFAPDDTYDVRVVPDVVPTGLNFVTLDTGVCVCLTEEEKLEVFHARKDSAAIRIVEDPILDGDVILGRQGGTLLCARGNKVYRLRMR